MKSIYIMTPETGDKKKDVELAKKACWYFRMDGISVSPTLTLSYLEDSDWMKKHLAKELLEKCDRVAVFADELTEQMIDEIKRARELKLPISFYDATLHEINYDTLVINKRIGPGYRKIIAEANGETCCSGMCPYGSECCVKSEAEDVIEKDAPAVPNTKVEEAPKKGLLARIFGRQ